VELRQDKGGTMSDFRKNGPNKGTNFEINNNTILTLGVVLLSIALLISVVKLNSSVFRTSYHFDQEGLERDICAVGMTSVINGDASSAFVTSNLISYLEKENYPDFDFKILSKSQIKHSEIVGTHKCRLLIQNPDIDKSMGLISLQVFMKEDSSYQVKYKIENYQELLLTKSDVQMGRR